MQDSFERFMLVDFIIGTCAININYTKARFAKTSPQILAFYKRFAAKKVISWSISMVFWSQLKFLF
jgi:hypothetical protein